METMLSASCGTPVKPQDRQFIQRCRKALLACSAAYIILNFVMSNYVHGRVAVGLAALSGVLFFSLLMLTAALLSRLRDEFQRALLLRSFLWASAITFAMACIWGSIEAQSRYALPRIPMLILPVLLVVFTAGAKVLIFRKNRPGVGDE